MTRFAIDAPTALRIVADGVAVPADHRLVGPTLLRSDALAAIHRDRRAGRLDDASTKRLLEGIAGLKIRLLGDRVSRATALRVASDRDLPDTGPAEYVAVAALQADVLVTDNEDLVRAAGDSVPCLGYDSFLAGLTG